jgi:hypothetical protein
MEINEVSELFANFSLEEVLQGDLTLIFSLLYLVVSLALCSIMIWYFYRFIARRDCFKVDHYRHPIVVSCLSYFLLFPVVATLFFTGFALILVFLTRNFEIPQLLATSFVLVVAIRFTAYYSEDLSKDVAKMLPFAVLGLVVVNPTFFNFEDILGTINSLPGFFNLAVQFILFIVLIEWVLRIALFGKHLIFSSSHSRSIKKKSVVSS